MPCFGHLRASLVAQSVKSMPEMWESRVPSLGQEDPLEKEMPTHSSILAWRIPLTEEPGGLQSMRLKSRINTMQVVYLLIGQWTLRLFHVLAAV